MITSPKEEIWLLKLNDSIWVAVSVPSLPELLSVICIAPLLELRLKLYSAKLPVKTAVSVPSPPINVSSPIPPLIMSAPAPPVMVFLKVLPIKVSLYEEPIAFSITQLPVEL